MYISLEGRKESQKIGFGHTCGEERGTRGRRKEIDLCYRENLMTIIRLATLALAMPKIEIQQVKKRDLEMR